MNDGVRIAVGVSGQGSNLRALFEAQHEVEVLHGCARCPFAEVVVARDQQQLLRPTKHEQLDAVGALHPFNRFFYIYLECLLR